MAPQPRVLPQYTGAPGGTGTPVFAQVFAPNQAQGGQGQFGAFPNQFYDQQRAQQAAAGAFLSQFGRLPYNRQDYALYNNYYRQFYGLSQSPNVFHQQQVADYQNYFLQQVNANRFPQNVGPQVPLPNNPGAAPAPAAVRAPQAQVVNISDQERALLSQIYTYRKGKDANSVPAKFEDYLKNKLEEKKNNPANYQQTFRGFVDNQGRFLDPDVAAEQQRREQQKFKIPAYQTELKKEETELIKSRDEAKEKAQAELDKVKLAAAQRLADNKDDSKIAEIEKENAGKIEAARKLYLSQTEAIQKTFDTNLQTLEERSKTQGFRLPTISNKQEDQSTIEKYQIVSRPLLDAVNTMRKRGFSEEQITRVLHDNWNSSGVGQKAIGEARTAAVGRKDGNIQFTRTRSGQVMPLDEERMKQAISEQDATGIALNRLLGSADSPNNIVTPLSSIDQIRSAVLKLKVNKSSTLDEVSQHLADRKESRQSARTNSSNSPKDQVSELDDYLTTAYRQPMSRFRQELSYITEAKQKYRALTGRDWESPAIRDLNRQAQQKAATYDPRYVDGRHITEAGFSDRNVTQLAVSHILADRLPNTSQPVWQVANIRKMLQPTQIAMGRNEYGNSRVSPYTMSQTTNIENSTKLMNLDRRLSALASSDVGKACRAELSTADTAWRAERAAAGTDREKLAAADLRRRGAYETALGDYAKQCSVVAKEVLGKNIDPKEFQQSLLVGEYLRSRNAAR